MKNDLTDKQKETITFIESQFKALNESNKDVPFNLVDVNKLSAEINRIKIGKQDVEIHNKAITELRYELIDKVVKQLNEDFERGNLPIEAKLSGCHDISIRPYGQAYHSEVNFNLEIRSKQIGTEFGTKVTGEFYYTDSCISNNVYKTVEEYLNSDYIQKKFIRLLQDCEKNNRTR
jgi:hypothetical protein